MENNMELVFTTLRRVRLRKENGERERESGGSPPQLMNNEMINFEFNINLQFYFKIYLYHDLN